MIAFKHRSPAQLGMALYRRFLFLLVSMPSYISVIEFALESSTYRTARRPFRSNLRLAGSSLVPACFQLGSSLVPAWFQLVPSGSSWFQLASSLVPAWFQLVPSGSSWFQLVPAWFQLGSGLVPAWFRLVPAGCSLVPAWFRLGSGLS